MQFPLLVRFATVAVLFPLLAGAAKVPVRQAKPSATGETGPADAPVTMVVFSDFACPYSAQLFFTLEKLESKYPTQLHVISKQSPLDIHPDAPRAHRAALAAGRQGHFHEMAELLYANQTRLDEISLLAYARQLHLDMPRFRRDLNSAPLETEVNGDMQLSRAFGVSVTPTLYLNGKAYVGIQSEQTLSGLIEKSLRQANLAPSTAANTADAYTPPLDSALLAALQSAPAAEKGNKAAPLTIVEFTDFQCPFCRAAVEPLEALMASRGQDVRWVFRSFPLDFHPDSELANEAALAAGEQGKFWQMHDLLFARQTALKLPELREYAQELHLDMHSFDEALSTHKFAGAIAADRALGIRAGVSGTPTFVIDGHLMTGARSLPELVQMADSHKNLPPGMQTQLSATVVTPSMSRGHVVLGSADANINITWFTDVRSPLAAGQADLLRSLSSRYGDRLRVIYRSFPVDAHPDGRLCAAALLAALRQDKFWVMFDSLSARSDVLDREKVLEIASHSNMDRSGFELALDAAAIDVTADLDDAGRRGIRGAPVFFLNAQRVDGLQSKNTFTSILDSELSKQSASVR